MTPVEVNWNTSYTYVEGKITYWTKIKGNYDINLGDAAITMQSGGTLSVYVTNTDWATPNGIGITSNTDPYHVWNGDGEEDEGTGGGHMAVFVGRPGSHIYGGIEYHVNTFNYPCTHSSAASESVGMDDGTYNGTLTYEAKDGTEHTVQMPETAYSMTTLPNYGYNGKMTFGFTLGSAMDENGNITGLQFTSPETFLTPDITEDGLATSQSMSEDEEGGTQVKLALTAYINNDNNSVQLPNLGYGFDLENLRSWGTSTIDNSGSWALDPNAITYIIITKDLPVEGVPEPATATLSLLALAGLAARRRRK